MMTQQWRKQCHTALLEPGKVPAFSLDWPCRHQWPGATSPTLECWISAQMSMSHLSIWQGYFPIYEGLLYLEGAWLALLKALRHKHTPWALSTGTCAWGRWAFCGLGGYQDCDHDATPVTILSTAVCIFIPTLLYVFLSLNVNWKVASHPAYRAARDLEVPRTNGPLFLLGPFYWCPWSAELLDTQPLFHSHKSFTLTFNSIVSWLFHEEYFILTPLEEHTMLLYPKNLNTYTFEGEPMFPINLYHRKFHLRAGEAREVQCRITHCRLVERW